ncbi:hypothetical protein L249_3558 [Ophiocordyceps polyrhachis-furcata BCC 54312]|uniref:Uncharacterized protein n=1 Tax=Ophiocordyceps polyrhachis-furcata BCC 54312 TaxID=1330021 RepID=A0A367LME2_9HYPO|nr:hypothetical protein L249_3558 [Ophiocordyceps polyrhachis-furcata BCC 54312]
MSQGSPSDRSRLDGILSVVVSDRCKAQRIDPRPVGRHGMPYSQMLGGHEKDIRGNEGKSHAGMKQIRMYVYIIWGWDECNEFRK